MKNRCYAGIHENKSKLVNGWQCGGGLDVKRGRRKAVGAFPRKQHHLANTVLLMHTLLSSLHFFIR